MALPRGLRWLDVGCGNGAFTEQVVERCAAREVHAIDPSDAQLAYAHSRNGVARVNFPQGDAQLLPFRDATFDAAAMALVISFVPDQSLAVTEMRRVVRPAGSVSTYMWDVAGGRPIEPLLAAMKTLGIAFPLLGAAGHHRMDCGCEHMFRKPIA